ncbi:hypothetical protein DYB31_009614 [Aphanomyces astaci]|uniref:Uncharacterized protein n=1 Tax=Aphanomyces astaci TaxID=112090 RepID=A0A397FCZ7_APHAT|nr:hypothetical protein DYB31_009614 [Aphanomyces astaci]
MSEIYLQIMFYFVCSPSEHDVDRCCSDRANEALSCAMRHRTCHQRVVKMRGNCGVTVEVVMTDEGKKRKANEIAEDADDSVEEAEAPTQQVEVVDLTAESDDDDGVAPSEDAAELARPAADLVKSAMQTVGAEGVQKLLEQHLAREEAAKKARAAEEVKGKARRAEEAKAIAAAATKAADEAAKEAAEAARKVTSEGVTGTPSGDGGHPNAMGVGGNERKASGVGTAVMAEAKVKAEVVGPERTGLARDEVFERELGFHWDRSRIFTPAGWGGVDLEYVRGVTRHLTVVREFDETREDWGYQVANAAGVERYLRLFASAQSFELRVMWMLLLMECMQLARVSFHRFDEFKGAMRELHERERLEHWTVDVGRIELCNDETLLEYIVAFVWTLIGQGIGRHGQLPLTAGRLANSLSNFAGVWRQKHGRLDARSRLVQRMGFADGEFLDVGARRCTGASNGGAGGGRRIRSRGYNQTSGPQQGGQLIAAERQAAADYRAGARAIEAPQQVVMSMSRTATVGESEEEEKSEAAEEEEPPRDPKDRLPSLHRS